MIPRIVILEGIHSAGVECLNKYASIDLRLGLSYDQILDIIGEYHAIIVKSVTRVDAGLLAAAPNLVAVGRAGTGTENIDLDAAKRRGVTVLTVPTRNTISTAEFTVTLMLNLCRRIEEAIRRVGARDFRRSLLLG